jgi:hypothetical protein
LHCSFSPLREAGAPGPGPRPRITPAHTRVLRSEESAAAPHRGDFTTGEAPRGEVEAWPGRPTRAERCERRDASANVALAGGAALGAQRALKRRPPRPPAPHGLGAPAVCGVGPRQSHRKDARGQGDVTLLRQERASMKTRPGIIDDAARARAVMPSSPPFTARDRSGHPTAGRTLQARVPARQSARRPIIHVDYRARRPTGAERTAGSTRHAGCLHQPFVGRGPPAARVTGRDARGPDLPTGVSNANTSGPTSRSSAKKRRRDGDPLAVFRADLQARRRRGHLSLRGRDRRAGFIPYRTVRTVARM